jgi:4'-phosphopantetheinyl transferase
VHVWRADLEAVTEDPSLLLCPEEHTRAERILREPDRQLWTRARGVLRALLGRYLQKDPRTLRLATGAHGKPTLVDDVTSSFVATKPASALCARPSFNVSHSGRLAVYAFTETGDVGVDVEVEVARRPIDEVAIAARAFGPAAALRLEGLDPAIREREFLRGWVRYEAALKCRGTGIGGGATRGSGGEPWIAELDVGLCDVDLRAAAAVALERPPRELCCWEYQL